MKKYQFEINQYASNLFFPEERVKEKTRIIEILLEATRYILCSQCLEQLENKNKLILLVDKMSRLFFFKENKYFSIVFPFTVVEDENGLNFTYQNFIDVDSQLISNSISIIKEDNFKSICSLDFVESIYNYENEYDENFWIFIKELLTFEDGYIRYDYDEKGFKEASEKGKEDIHPLNHYDIFYSNKATFKIGLVNKISENDFLDILDTNTVCNFIKTATNI